MVTMAEPRADHPGRDQWILVVVAVVTGMGLGMVGRSSAVKLVLEGCPDYTVLNTSSVCECMLADYADPSPTVKWVHQPSGIVLSSGEQYASLALNYRKTDDCYDGWSFHNDSNTCLRYFKHSVGWKTARNSCQAFSGDLVRIPDQSTQNFVIGLLEPPRNLSVFIGLSDPRMFYWLDNRTTPVYTNFHDDEATTSGDCAVISSRNGSWGWQGHDCKAELPFICEARPVREGICFPEGLAHNFHTKTCFGIWYNPKNWTNARQICARKYEGDLATISNDQVMGFIIELFLATGGFELIYIGLHNPREFLWLKNTTDMGSYKAWEDHFLEGSNGKDCAVIQEENAWALRACSEPNPFLCQMPTVPVSIPNQNYTCQSDVNGYTLELLYTAKVAYGPHRVIPGPSPLPDFILPATANDSTFVIIHCDVEKDTFNPSIDVELEANSTTVDISSISPADGNSPEVLRFKFRVYPTEEGVLNLTCAVENSESNHVVANYTLLTVRAYGGSGQGSGNTASSTTPTTSTTTTTGTTTTTTPPPTTTTTAKSTTTKRSTNKVGEITYPKFDAPTTTTTTTSTSTKTTPTTTKTPTITTTTTTSSTSTKTTPITTKTPTTSTTSTTTAANNNINQSQTIPNDPTTEGPFSPETTENTPYHSNPSASTEKHPPSNTTPKNNPPNTTVPRYSRLTTKSSSPVQTTQNLTPPYPPSDTFPTTTPAKPPPEVLPHRPTTDSKGLELCPCKCTEGTRRYNLTRDQVDELTSTIKEELTVDVDALSSTTRRQTSATDYRTTALVTGTFGVILLTSAMLFIFVSDLIGWKQTK